jgi:hypothetical protein
MESAALSTEGCIRLTTRELFEPADTRPRPNIAPCDNSES